MNTFAKIITASALALISSASMAATDGSLGADSTGTSDLSLTINDRVQITGVDDIALGAYSGSGVLTGETEFCVYRNGGDNYKVTLTTDQASFVVKSATTLDTIAFSASIDDDLDASDGESLTYNTASAVALAGSNSVTCGGSSNAALQVSFAEAALQAAASANDYQATVTVFVEPI
ncbi:MAG: hypothetical protein KDI36_01930 [Pseudomonadales bacterium]|nr:hypothetical protein [Pseudomonadales bacterium]